MLEAVDDERFMEEALRLADEARDSGEVPVGSVVVYDGRVIATGRNARESEQDPFAHAEMRAMREAARVLGRWRLTGATVYVTLEPCPMCAGAIVNARVDRVVYGCSDPKTGAVESIARLLEHPSLNHMPEVRAGVRADEAGEKLRAFFKARRLAAREKNEGRGEMAELAEGA